MKTAQIDVPVFITGIIQKIEVDICMEDGVTHQIKSLTGTVRLKAASKEVAARLKKYAGKRLRVTIAGYPVWSVECMYLSTYYAGPSEELAKLLNINNFS